MYSHFSQSTYGAIADYYSFFTVFPVVLVMFGILSLVLGSWKFLLYPVVAFLIGPLIASSTFVGALSEWSPFYVNQRLSDTLSFYAVLLSYALVHVIFYVGPRLLKLRKPKDVGVYQPTRPQQAAYLTIVAMAIAAVYVAPILAAPIKDDVSKKQSAVRLVQTDEYVAVAKSDSTQFWLYYPKLPEMEDLAFRYMTKQHDSVSYELIKRGKPTDVRSVCGAKGNMTYQKTPSGFEYGTYVTTNEFGDHHYACFVLDGKRYELGRWHETGQPAFAKIIESYAATEPVKGCYVVDIKTASRALVEANQYCTPEDKAAFHALNEKHLTLIWPDRTPQPYPGPQN